MLWIGCSGFPVGMKRYMEVFNTVEVQKTFYKIPRVSVLEKWKKMSKESFVFNIKAFQGVTHPVSSPTWKRFGKIEGNYGFLKPNKFVFDSWEKTLSVAKILGSKIILIQLPKSFRDEEENWENAEKFFSKIDREGIEIAIELRGWKEENVKKFCKRFELIDAVDLNVRKPLYTTKKKILYVRFHGKYIDGRIKYSYKFSKGELEKMKKLVEEVKAKEKWIYFNNSFMWENALEFKKLFASDDVFERDG